MTGNNEKINKLDTIQPSELVALASSLSICLGQKLSIADIATLRQFLSCLCSNLALFEYQHRNWHSGKDKKG